MSWLSIGTFMSKWAPILALHNLQLEKLTSSKLTFESQFLLINGDNNSIRHTRLCGFNETRSQVLSRVWHLLYA